MCPIAKHLNNLIDGLPTNSPLASWFSYDDGGFASPSLQRHVGQVTASHFHAPRSSKPSISGVFSSGRDRPLAEYLASLRFLSCRNWRLLSWSRNLHSHRRRGGLYRQSVGHR